MNPRIAAAIVSCLTLAVLLPSPASAFEVEKDVVYATRGDIELKLDIAFQPDAEMRPAVLLIHGGGWKGGQRSSFHGQMKSLAGLGYVAATIDYRLTDVASWPAQIEDVRAAHRWLVEHADDYGIDPERIAALGGSAGAHLSLVLGTAPSETQESLRLRGVVNFFGPAELRDIKKIEHVRELVEALVAGKLEERSEVLREVSPVVHIDRTDPPVLTFHGTEDKIVPIEQADILHAALDEQQIPNRLFRMKGADHGIGGDVEQIDALQKAFLHAYLRGSDMPLLVHEDFNDGIARWEPTDTSAWQHGKNDGRTFYALTKKRSDYNPKVRSPYNISLLKGVEVSDFVLDVDLRSTHEPYGHQDLCLFFGHQDPTHFYYVHIGRKADAHANSIFLVNDAPRVSIAQERTDGTDWSRGWHRARIRRDAENGTIEVFFDDMQHPIMTTVDKTFPSGRIGIGSFDDTGDFDAVRLWGEETSSG